MAELDDMQKTVVQWGFECFGSAHMLDPVARSARFLEEAAELTQAAGPPLDHALRVLFHVYQRPVGKIDQEVGGSMNTLVVLADTLGLSAHECMTKEIARCLALSPEHFAKRNREKEQKVDQPFPHTEEMARAASEHSGITNLGPPPGRK